ncbi:MAG: HAMP domain-containing sensor histidine kinase [Microscillaceae bacterium]|nr:HAMP domain-containing sensor histidine kinase [Microscillaceae bacterium]
MLYYYDDSILNTCTCFSSSAWNIKLIKMTTDLNDQEIYANDSPESFPPLSHSELNLRLKAALRVMDSRLGTQDIRLQSVIKELDLFLYRAAHDLRRPIASIMGLVNLIRHTDDQSELQELLNKIEETSHSMDRLLTKLRMVNDIQEKDLSIGRINFERMLRHIRSSLGKYLDLHTCFVDIEYSEEAPFVNNDTLVFTILFNILENAVQYRQETEARIEISYHSIVHLVHIQIKDYGVGIPLAEQGKIFDMFYKGSGISPGSGLGLYIVKRAVKRLGGLLKLKSEPNQYTLFEILIPNKAYLKGSNLHT